MLMTKTRVLNEQEKCEIISALANAKVNNAKKAKSFRGDANGAHHREDVQDMIATADRNEMWAQLDESLIELIRDGRIVIVEDGDED
jgi:hypothetical protein